MIETICWMIRDVFFLVIFMQLAYLRGWMVGYRCESESKCNLCEAQNDLDKAYAKLGRLVHEALKQKTSEGKVYNAETDAEEADHGKEG